MKETRKTEMKERNLIQKLETKQRKPAEILESKDRSLTQKTGNEPQKYNSKT